MQSNTKLTVGTPVASNFNDRYLGKVVEVTVKTWYTVMLPDGTTSLFDETEIKLSEKLTEAEAWQELPLVVLENIKGHGSVLYASDLREIRHQCYKFLGGNGIKITEEAKERVRTLIARTAPLLGLPIRDMGCL